MPPSTHSYAPGRGLRSPIGAAKPRKTRRRIRAGKKSEGFHDQEDRFDPPPVTRHPTPPGLDARHHPLRRPPGQPGEVRTHPEELPRRPPRLHRLVPEDLSGAPRPPGAGPLRTPRVEGPPPRRPQARARHRQPQARRPEIVPPLGRRRGPGPGDGRTQIHQAGQAAAPMARPQGAARLDPRRRAQRPGPRHRPGRAPAPHRPAGRRARRPALGRPGDPRPLGQAHRPPRQGPQAAAPSRSTSRPATPWPSSAPSAGRARPRRCSRASAGR